MTLSDSDLKLWNKVKESVIPLSKKDKVSHSFNIKQKPPKTTKQKHIITSTFNHIESEIDLHGYTLQEAHDIFFTFVYKAFKNNKKLVLVITGTGVGDTSIKREIIFWCEKDIFKKYIRDIQQAKQEHGGNGAFYVFIRKRL